MSLSYMLFYALFGALLTSLFFFSSRRRHTISLRDWSSDVCSSDLPPNGFPGTQEGYTCLNDPYYGSGPYQGCLPPLQTYDYIINPTRTSYEIRLASKAGTRIHWLGGFYWEKTIDKNYSNTYFMPNLQ